MAEKSSELDGVIETDNLTGNASLQKRTDDYSLSEAETSESETSEEMPGETIQIREQIVETRRGMSETIDAIQEKLSLANISEQVQTQVSEQITNVVETAKDAIYGKTADVVNTVSRGFRDLGETDLVKKAQQNPTALALIGAGIGALLVGILFNNDKKSRRKNKLFRHEDDSYRYEYNYDENEVRYTDSVRHSLKSNVSTSGEPEKSTFQAARTKAGDTAASALQTVSETASSAYAGVTGAAGTAFETVGAAAGKTYETVGSAAGKTYEKAGELGGQMKVNYEHYIEKNPLAVGAVALAVGAVVGFAIPLTQKENEYLGEYRDSVLEKAQATATEAIDSVKQMATEAQKVITEEVKSKTA